MIKYPYSCDQASYSTHNAFENYFSASEMTPYWLTLANSTMIVSKSFKLHAPLMLFDYKQTFSYLTWTVVPNLYIHFNLFGIVDTVKLC